MDEEQLNSFLDELLGKETPVEENTESTWRSTLMACVGRNLELRDRNHMEPYKLLLYTEELDTLESVELSELALRHPWDEPDGRWQGRDVGKLLKLKLTLWRQSMAAHALAKEGVMRLECGTVVVVIPKDQDLPFLWVELKARTVGD